MGLQPTHPRLAEERLQIGVTEHAFVELIDDGLDCPLPTQ